MWYPNEQTVTADVGYWRHGRLIRLVQTVDTTPGFSWMTQFPEYLLYSNVRGEFENPDRFDRLKRTLSKVENQYLSRCAMAAGQKAEAVLNCFGDDVPQSLLERGSEALFHQVSL